MHACELLHAHNEKFYRGINYFRGGPNISEIFGPGGPNIMGVQIFRYSTHVFVLLVIVCSVRALEQNEERLVPAIKSSCQLINYLCMG